MPAVELAGLRTKPLASYLAAIGVFRLVSEQADQQVRARWVPMGFVLESELDDEALEHFLSVKYGPSGPSRIW